MRAAAIGIGSNSLRLLVADMDNGMQTTVRRERAGLRVFASLNAKHEIDEAMIHNACEAVLLMKQSAERAGAETVRLFATSAVRDAKNKAAFANALLRRTGLTLDIISGVLEAKLSYLGAAGSGSAGMIDIGGGSTELVIGDGGTPLYSCSLQAGAVRLYREIPVSSAADTQRVMDAVQRLLTPHIETIRQMKTPTRWVGVGGTMTAAATCIQGIDWRSHGKIHGFIAQRPELHRVTAALAAMTPDQRKALGTVPPDRADIAVHGFAILLGCMEALSIDQIQISEQTNLDGYLQTITADG